MARTIDIVLAFLLVLLIAVLIPVRAHAAGSLSREEFLDEISNPVLREFIRGNFKLEEPGRANRMGREDPKDAGKRIAPFEMVARVPGGHERVVLQVNELLKIVPCQESEHFAPHCMD